MMEMLHYTVNEQECGIQGYGLFEGWMRWDAMGCTDSSRFGVHNERTAEISGKSKWRSVEVPANSR